jgi:hypothetical protein
MTPSLGISYIIWNGKLRGNANLVVPVYVLDFLCHFLAFLFRFSAQTLPLFAH